MTLRDPHSRLPAASLYGLLFWFCFFPAESSYFCHSSRLDTGPGAKAEQNYLSLEERCDQNGYSALERSKARTVNHTEVQQEAFRVSTEQRLTQRPGRWAPFRQEICIKVKPAWI